MLCQAGETHRSFTVFDMAANLKCSLYPGVLENGGEGVKFFACHFFNL